MGATHQRAIVTHYGWDLWRAAGLPVLLPFDALQKEHASSIAANGKIAVDYSWERFLPRVHDIDTDYDDIRPATTNTVTVRDTAIGATSSKKDHVLPGISNDWRITSVASHQRASVPAAGIWRTPIPSIRSLTGSLDTSPIDIINGTLVVDRTAGIVPLPVHRLWPASTSDISLHPSVCDALRAIMAMTIHRVMREAVTLSHVWAPSGRQNSITSRDIQSSVRVVFAGEVAKYMVSYTLGFLPH